MKKNPILNDGLNPHDLARELVVKTALVEMYQKALATACRLLEEQSDKTFFEIWNEMISEAER